MVYSILSKVWYTVFCQVWYTVASFTIAQAYYTITYQAFVIVPINWYFPPHRV